MKPIDVVFTALVISFICVFILVMKKEERTQSVCRSYRADAMLCDTATHVFVERRRDAKNYDYWCECWDHP